MPDPTPLNEHLGMPSQAIDPNYLRDAMALQANTTGMTSMQPSMSPTAPVQRQFTQPGPQQTSAFGVGERGAHQRESMQNLVKASQSLANQFGQQAQAKQNREYEQVIGRFMGATQGVAQAQAQVLQATQALKQNPNDPQAQQQLQTAKAALQQNQTILNDMSQDKKAHKVITKAFGVDDKNANSPERAAAIEAVKKQMGVGGAAAGIMSQLPQTQQLSPQAQAQAQAVQNKVVATPTQMMQEVGKDARLAVTEQGRDTRASAADELKQQQLEDRRREHGFDPKTGDPIPIEKLPEKDQARIAEERATIDYRESMSNFTMARQRALSDPNSPQYRIAALRAQGALLGNQARMIQAQTGRMNYDMRALGVDAQGNPLPGTVNVGGQTIGTSIAPNLEKVMTSTAAFTDIRGAMSNLEAATIAMQQSGTSFRDPVLTKFLTDLSSSKDPGTIKNIVSQIAGSNLNSAQQDYARQYAQAVENISALRGALKGSTAQSNIERMIRTLPGPATPNYQYALAQIKAISGQNGQLDRLQTGLPSMNVSGKSSPASAPASPNQLKPPSSSGGFNWDALPKVGP